VWILGAGPFQRGSIYDGTAFAGKALRGDDENERAAPRRLPSVELTNESTFTRPEQLAKALPTATNAASTTAPAPAAPAHSTAPEPSVVQASHQEPQPVAAPPADAKPIEQPEAQAAAEHPEPAKPSETQSAYDSAPSKSLPQPRFDSR
jgi:hypothetical protein